MRGVLLEPRRLPVRWPTLQAVLRARTTMADVCGVRRGRVLPAHASMCLECSAEVGGGFSAARASDGATPQQLERLVDWHLREVPFRVDVWLVPCTQSCALVFARIVLWRRWGCFAGLLQGPPDGVVTRGGGRHGRTCRADLFGAWLGQLRAEGGWPQGDAPVLLTGVPEGKLAAVRCASQLASWEPGGLHLDFPVERLRAWPGSLSRNVPGAVANWSLADFLARPLEHSCGLVLSTGSALEAAGVPRRQPRSWTSAAGLAFRRSLHVPPA
jgi:hypothetical protein